jgi:hypothetical protein
MCRGKPEDSTANNKDLPTSLLRSKIIVKKGKIFFFCKGKMNSLIFFTCADSRIKLGNVSKNVIYTVSSHNRHAVLRPANKSHGTVPLKKQSQVKHFKRNVCPTRCVWTWRNEQREVEVQDHQLLPGQRLLLELEYVLPFS